MVAKRQVVNTGAFQSRLQISPQPFRMPRDPAIFLATPSRAMTSAHCSQRSQGCSQQSVLATSRNRQETNSDDKALEFRATTFRAEKTIQVHEPTKPVRRDSKKGMQGVGLYVVQGLATALPSVSSKAVHRDAVF